MTWEDDTSEKTHRCGEWTLDTLKGISQKNTLLIDLVHAVPFHTEEDCAAGVARQVKRQNLLNVAVPCLFAQNPISDWKMWLRHQHL